MQHCERTQWGNGKQRATTLNERRKNGDGRKSEGAGHGEPINVRQPQIKRLANCLRKELGSGELDGMKAETLEGRRGLAKIMCLCLGRMKGQEGPSPTAINFVYWPELPAVRPNVLTGSQVPLECVYSGGWPSGHLFSTKKLD